MQGLHLYRRTYVAPLACLLRNDYALREIRGVEVAVLRWLLNRFATEHVDDAETLRQLFQGEWHGKVLSFERTTKNTKNTKITKA
jgi:hypothetical protein